MPTYEYQCQACGHQLEAFQKITEDALKECPACKKLTLERLISGGAFHLKGGGWYKDGYGSQSGKKPRTENDRIDKLTKSIDEDKKKTSEAAASASSETSGSTSGSTSDSSAGSTGSSTPSTPSTPSS
jgi:putative FmdB family regulatory protein